MRTQRTIGSRGTKFGDVVKYEEGMSHGICRRTETVQLTSTSQIGDVLYNNSGVWQLVDAANISATGGLVVLIDNDVYECRPESGTQNETMAVLYRGTAVLADDSLNFAADIDTDAERQQAYAVLEGQNGIEVEQQV